MRIRFKEINLKYIQKHMKLKGITTIFDMAVYFFEDYTFKYVIISKPIHCYLTHKTDTNYRFCTSISCVCFSDCIFLLESWHNIHSKRIAIWNPSLNYSRDLFLIGFLSDWPSVFFLSSLAHLYFEFLHTSNNLFMRRCCIVPAYLFCIRQCIFFDPFDWNLVIGIRQILTWNRICCSLKIILTSVNLNKWLRCVGTLDFFFFKFLFAFHNRIVRILI